MHMNDETGSHLQFDFFEKHGFDRNDGMVILLLLPPIHTTELDNPNMRLSENSLQICHWAVPKIFSGSRKGLEPPKEQRLDG
jgi:hypothetical protein